MISIIMPTMWRPPHYKRMLPILNEHPLIGEIIIIDNDISKTDHEVLKLDKVIHLPQESNIYVNPAWNLGAETAKCDKICLMNDDILFATSCLENVNNFLSPQVGIVGFDFESVILTNKEFVGENIVDNILEFPFIDEGYSNEIIPIGTGWTIENGVTVEHEQFFHRAYGICMFMHKESYSKIPEKYKIFFGDNHLIEMNKYANRENFQISDSMVMTEMHTTSRSQEIRDILEEDMKEYKLLNPGWKLV